MASSGGGSNKKPVFIRHGSLQIRRDVTAGDGEVGEEEGAAGGNKKVMIRHGSYAQPAAASALDGAPAKSLLIRHHSYVAKGEAFAASGETGQQEAGQLASSSRTSSSSSSSSSTGSSEADEGGFIYTARVCMTYTRSRW
jgi:hypothetical protein